MWSRPEHVNWVFLGLVDAWRLISSMVCRFGWRPPPRPMRLPCESGTSRWTRSPLASRRRHIDPLLPADAQIHASAFVLPSPVPDESLARLCYQYESVLLHP